MKHNCWYTVQDPDLGPFPKPLNEVLRTMTVCRRFYAESKLLPFAINTLSGGLRMIVATNTSMPKKVIEAITTVKILFGYGQWDKEGSRALAPLT
jgi:hypothetical protein